MPSNENGLNGNGHAPLAVESNSVNGNGRAPPAVEPNSFNGNGRAPTAVEPESGMPYLSTEPSPNQSWTITLKDKVIAITGANRGIGLGIAQVCLENSASKVYSLDLMEPSEDFALLSKKHPNFKYIQTDVTKDESIETEKVVEENIVKAEARWPENNPFASTSCWHLYLAYSDVDAIFSCDQRTTKLH